MTGLVPAVRVPADTAGTNPEGLARKRARRRTGSSDPAMIAVRIERARDPAAAPRAAPRRTSPPVDARRSTHRLLLEGKDRAGRRAPGTPCALARPVRARHERRS